MNFIGKTQLAAIGFAVGWLIYLNILALANDSNQTMPYIDWLVYILAFLLGTAIFFYTKRYIGKQWLAAPFVLVPYIFLYHPLLPIFQRAISSEGYNQRLLLFFKSTSPYILLITALAFMGGILFTKKI
ncbi:hypothetical protein AM500_23620 [Bacillus sp. FJAT-18017]|uniref:hypothetical protein n=1 Tax=Bacillus sp. FJAT-18017 TaxID=1705566 RepID=UPI0006AF5D92|nr:hypothetical protein [Bacillus sp. FJAT-18017]ALC92419.1 hypothetical protein AM500_23620 [Bacillus sp. FJAT-18017]